MSTPRAGDGLHRTILLFTGIVVLAGGVGGLLLGANVFGGQIQHKPVFQNFITIYIGTHGQWLWPLIAFALLCVGLLSVRWIATQLHTARVSELDLPAERRGGRTLVNPAALSAAITGEIETYHGVRSAHAAWLGQPRDAGLRLVVTHAPNADLPRLLDRLETQALTHLREALDRPDIPVQLDLRAQS